MSDDLSTESQQSDINLDVNSIIATAVAVSDRLLAEPEKIAEPECPPTPSRSDSFTTDWRRRWSKLNSTQRGWLLASVAAFCLGLIFSWIIKADYEKRLASQEWPIVSGAVIGVDTVTDSESSEYGLDRYHYHARLAIEYVVNDMRYNVELEDTARQYSTEGGALAAHTRGESQKLYVNPANPAEAVLYFDKLPLAGWIGTSQAVMIFCVFVAVMLLLLARSSGTS